MATEGKAKGTLAEPGARCDAECETGPKRINPEIFWLLAVFVLAVVMRTLAASTREMIQFDGASYARMAQNLLTGHAPMDITGSSATHLSILYPVVTASFSVMIRNFVTAGYVVSILFSSLLILPVYLFGKVMWSNRVGMAAAALVAVLPFLVDMGSQIDGQNLFGFWVLCAMFFGYRMQFTKRCMCGMIAGTCLGIAYLDDPTALYYLVTLFILLVIIGFRQEVSNYANKAAAHFVLLFLLFAIPNVIFMTWQNSSLTLNDRPMDQLYAVVHNLQPGTIAWEEQVMGLDRAGDIRLNGLEQGPGLSGTLVSDPLGVLKASVRQDYDFYVRHAQVLIPLWLIPLFGLGLHKTVWTRREALKYCYFALLLVPLLTLPLKWTDVRFMLPYMGIFMLWVGRGWMNLEGWAISSMGELFHSWKAPSRQRVVQVLVAVLVLAPVAGYSIWHVAHADYPVEYRQAGEWLKDHGGDGGKVMSREDSTAYYAGADLVPMPYAAEQEIIDYGRRNGVDFLVISQPIVNSLRPQLAGLLAPRRAAYPGLTLVYSSGMGTDRETLIYQYSS